MLKLNSHPSGRHFLQIPGPTNVPDRILRAMDYPTIDHRGPEFQRLGRKIIGEIGQIFQTEQPVVIFPASGTGAWEAALVNTLSPGDKVIACETGQFATLWRAMAIRLGLEVVWLENVFARHARHAAAALSGIVVVHEFLTGLQWLAVGCVIAASVGATRSESRIAVPAPD